MTAHVDAGAAGPKLRTGATIGTMVPGLRVADLTGLAQAAEEHGYDAIFTPEAWGTESFSLVMAMALATKSIAVGTSILPIASWGDGQAADVVFTGGADPVLPTPFCIGAAGAAAVAPSAVAAALSKYAGIDPPGANRH